MPRSPTKWLWGGDEHLNRKLAVRGQATLIDSWEAALNKLVSSQLIKVTTTACTSQDDKNEQLCLPSSLDLTR